MTSISLVTYLRYAILHHPARQFVFTSTMGCDSVMHLSRVEPFFLVFACTLKSAWRTSMHDHTNMDNINSEYLMPQVLS